MELEHAEAQIGNPEDLKQELRLAVVMTGGVSLAVWMGGIARELNLLLHQGVPATDQSQRIARQYQDLLKLTQVSVSLDVLSGTSAGGINSAILALANVNDADIGQLRDLWLEAGSFGRLLRSPKDRSPSSILQGDGQLLTGLRTGLDNIFAGAANGDNGRKHHPPTDVFITTTLLDGQSSRFVDDYHTLVGDVDHHGLFHFDTERLVGKDAAERLALAARCSASFPVAFEPAHLTIGEDADADHPDMSNLSNVTQSCYVADGGLLANRPIAAAVRAVFDRPASGDIRRILLYVVPTATGTPVVASDALPGLGSAVMKDLAAMTSQSISADLAGIRAHNEAVQVRVDSYWQLAGIGLRDEDPLVSTDMYGQYRDRVSGDLARTLMDEALRQLDPAKVSLSAPGNADAAATGPVGDAADRVRADLADVIAGTLPATPPAVGDYEALAQLGRRGYDSAKVIVLSLISQAYTARPDLGQRQRLAAARQAVHDALPPPPPAAMDVTGMVSAVVRRDLTITALARPLAHQWATSQQTREELAEGWRRLAAAVADCQPVLAALVQPPRNNDDRANTDPMISYLETDQDVIANRLAELHIAHAALLPSPTTADQRLDLIEVSADTATLLDPRKDAVRKLTGFQLHHFGAFYKNAWRANDWMWGRLDGAGWFVHVLLDPSRLRTLARLGAGPAAFREQLTTVLSAIASAGRGEESSRTTDIQIPAPVQRELGELFDPAEPAMTSMPETAKWVAEGIQRTILEEELPCIAEQIHEDLNAGADINPDAQNFLAAIDDPARSQKDKLSACRISDETFTGEMNSRLFRTTLTVSELSWSPPPPRPLQTRCPGPSNPRSGSCTPNCSWSQTT